MSINNTLPPEVENAIRTLRDDNNLVDVIWGRLAAYSDLRSMEAMENPKSKQNAESVLAAVRELKGAIALAGYKTPQELTTIGNQWRDCLNFLESTPGRSTRNKSLPQLVGSLLNIFNSYGIPARKLSGFLKFTLPMIGEAPSNSAIDKELQVVRNSLK